MADSTRNSNQLADFCGARPVLLVAVSMVLLAMIMLLVPGQRLAPTFESLSLLVVFMQWLGLMSLAALCFISRWLRRMGAMANILAPYLIIQLVTLAVSEVTWRLSILITGSPPPGGHAVFLLRNLGLSMIISAVVLWVMDLQKKVRQRTEAEAQARIRALQARIRPHFLFNSMNTIAALTHIDADAAEQAILDLSEIYRATLHAGEALTSVAEEVELARHYLAVEQLRFGGRLTVHWNIDAGLEAVAMPPLIIQPLVENAVYHGIEPRADGGAIGISAVLDDNVVIAIQNPLPGRGDDTVRRGNQMALKNIHERLRIAYHGKADLRSSQDDKNYYVVLRLPLERYHGKTAARGKPK